METPEIGTVFRIAITKPFTTNDRFVFATKTIKGDSLVYSPTQIKVWPNPYYYYNPKQKSLDDNQVHFTHLPTSGRCIIRIFDLSGIPIRRINHSDTGIQFDIWDLRNNYGKKVASGIYIIHIETENGGKVLKLAVFRP